jgi:hypothetical protein
MRRPRLRSRTVESRLAQGPKPNPELGERIGRYLEVRSAADEGSIPLKLQLLGLLALATLLLLIALVIGLTS